MKEEAIYRMVPLVNLDLVTVVLAAIASFIVGMIWYSPALFGKQYMKMMGISEKDMHKNKDKMMGTMVQSFIGSIVMAYVFAHILVFMGSMTWMDAIVGAFWVWLGFVAITLYNAVLYEKKTMQWFYITAGHYLAGLIVMGLVLVLM